MPQLPVSPVVSQPPSASQSSSSPSSESGAGLEGAQGQNFGEVLTKQIKKEASRTASGEDGEPVAEKAEAPAVLPVDFSVLIASSSVSAVPVPVENMAGNVPSGVVAEAGLDKVFVRALRADEEGGPQEKSDALASITADSSVLTAPPAAPVVPAQVDLGITKASVEATASSVSMGYSRADEIQLAAKAAGGGKDLPQAISPQKEFSDRLQAMTDIPVDKANALLQSTDLSAAEQMSATGGGSAIGVIRQQEQPSTLSVAPRVGSAEWGGAVGEKVLWMANQSRQVAELHLNPPNLGPLEVRLTINGDQAGAMFVSHHAAVRDAIEAALPRLREMLADNGIMLGNTTVGSESFNQQQQAFDRRSSGGGARADVGMEGILAGISGSSRPMSQAHDGMVDIFA
ncbi:MAG: flagellar hook-length control protein FliK [Betaproteobacteria bacterium]|nr:flagellar hook-length control protein FliK [Betaproteobacteria bacterium]